MAVGRSYEGGEIVRRTMDGDGMTRASQDAGFSVVSRSIYMYTSWMRMSQTRKSDNGFASNW